MSRVLIIGGGIGGLFTGAILTKEGVEVTVVEKNGTVGGGLQSFTRFGEVFDTGMHIAGGMEDGGSVNRICRYLGIMDDVHIRPVNPSVSDSIYFSEDGRIFDLPTGREQYVRRLSEYFPNQSEQIREYVDALFRVTEELDLFYLRVPKGVTAHSDEFFMPASRFVERYITDEKLRDVVSFMSPFFSGRRDVTPTYLHAVLSVLIINGSTHFVGGTFRFAETLRDFIVRHGGEVITGDAVVSVRSSDGLITGVETAGGRRLTADYYVCAIHPSTFFRLLEKPSPLPKAYRERLDDVPSSYSAFTLNLKLKQNSFRYIDHSSYYLKSYGKMWSFDDENEEWPLGFLYLTPPSENQGEYATKMSITTPMLWKNVKKWENTYVGRRGTEYEDWKRECAEKLLVRMEEMYPGFRGCVEAVNSASPLTIRDYYGVKEGAMCGFSKDSGNLLLSHLPVVTKVKNLYLTGQNCNLHGLCGVSLTAINTSEAILGRDFVMNKIISSENVR